MEETPIVGDFILLVVPDSVSLIDIVASSALAVVLLQQFVRARQFGGRRVGRTPDGRVQDGQNEDDQAHDALSVDVLAVVFVVHRSAVASVPVVFALSVGTAGQRGPGQVVHVDGDHSGLKQTRLGHEFLNLRKNRNGTQNDAQNHIHRDEELVQFALSGVFARVIDEQQHRDGQRTGEHQGRAHEEGAQPALERHLICIK